MRVEKQEAIKFSYLQSCIAISVHNRIPNSIYYALFMQSFVISNETISKVMHLLAKHFFLEFLYNKSFLKNGLIALTISAIPIGYYFVGDIFYFFLSYQLCV